MKAVHKLLIEFRITDFFFSLDIRITWPEFFSDRPQPDFISAIFAPKSRWLMHFFLLFFFFFVLCLDFYFQRNKTHNSGHFMKRSVLIISSVLVRLRYQHRVMRLNEYITATEHLSSFVHVTGRFGTVAQKKKSEQKKRTTTTTATKWKNGYATKQQQDPNRIVSIHSFINLARLSKVDISFLLPFLLLFFYTFCTQYFAVFFFFLSIQVNHNQCHPSQKKTFDYIIAYFFIIIFVWLRIDVPVHVMLIVSYNDLVIWLFKKWTMHKSCAWKLMIPHDTFNWHTQRCAIGGN